jgi:poly(3-hydroxybutyrate) depolymerase
MAHWLGCEAADLFAAVAPVDAEIMGHACNPSRSIPVVFFRATDDTVAPYAGGQVVPGVIAPGALSSFEEWRTHDACAGDPMPTNSYCGTYASCDRGSEVVLCSLVVAGFSQLILRSRWVAEVGTTSRRCSGCWCRRWRGGSSLWRALPGPGRRS